MLIAYLRQLAEADLKAPVTDCVISVPCYPVEGRLLTAVLALRLKAGGAPCDARMLVNERLKSAYDAAEASSVATQHVRK
jgi:molecular chaperone DnaK (HSP70)